MPYATITFTKIIHEMLDWIKTRPKDNRINPSHATHETLRLKHWSNLKLFGVWKSDVEFYPATHE
jgi:hypothetical protein